MKQTITRRQVLQMAAVGSSFYLGGSLPSRVAASTGKPLMSPGCRGTKVKVARLFMGHAGGLWPNPTLDIDQEIRAYRAEMAKMTGELSDVDFVVDQKVGSVEDVKKLSDQLARVDGILAIHLNMGIRAVLDEILRSKRPTVVQAAPYSGHEWVGFGGLLRSELGARTACMLTSDRRQLAIAIRPFRALHHLSEAKILDVTTRPISDYARAVRGKFGTQIQPLSLAQTVEAYHAVPERDARAEARQWLRNATAVVEPSEEDVVKSCRLALAFEKLLDAENATVMTVDCYGSMYKPLCQQYAFPCIGFTRLNNMGLGGICESDLKSAMTYILLQGLAGKPGFISDPTIDESANAAILAHCLGTTKMDGPRGPAAPYKLRTIMERQEGAVPQVTMRTGQKVTQAILVGTDLLPYFTGTIVDAPDIDRGCRTKITVEVDGDVGTLWKNWSHGLHRVTVYGNLRRELEMFCRFAGVKMYDEAVEMA